MKYDELIRRTVKDYKGYIERAKGLQSTLKMARLVLKDCKIDPSIYIDYEVNISWSAKSMDDVKAVLKAFAKKGIMLDRFAENPTNPTWHLKYEGKGIRLHPYWSSGEAEGATCKLVQVGEETITRPIYKLQCDPEVPVPTTETEAPETV